MSAPSLQQLLDDIKSHLAAGRTIEAIKLYRDATGAGLAEAKEAVELIAAGKPPGGDGAVPRPDAAAMSEIESAIRSGRKIEAIRLYQQATEVDLKTAKEAVDALEVRLDPQAIAVRERAMRRVRHIVMIGVLVVMGLALLVSVLARWS